MSDDLIKVLEAAATGTDRDDGDKILFRTAAQRLRQYEIQIEKLSEALSPFALFYSAVKRHFDTDLILAPVVKFEHQSLVVGAFKMADRALENPTPWSGQKPKGAEHE